MMADQKKNTSQGIVAWPQSERPRERLLLHGPQTLTDAELVGILFRVGLQGSSAVELAHQIFWIIWSLQEMRHSASRTVEHWMKSP